VAAQAIGQSIERVVAAAIGSIVGGWLLGAAVHRVSTRTGVSDVEAYGSLPGDDVIPHPMVEWTRGITVRTTSERVWPWLAQMGYGRGAAGTPHSGLTYSPTGGCSATGPRSRLALTNCFRNQHVAVGDIICDGPNYASYFRVQQVDPRQALVYRSIRHPRRGSPIDITDPESPSKIEKQLRDSGTYFDFTWALVLRELPQDRTRLLVRTRANYSPPAARLLSLPLGLVDATYGVAMLRAIARRAETVVPPRP
jgi:hypothetical protein